MSNANYDSSMITSRRSNKQFASVFNQRINPLLPNNPSKNKTSYGPIPGNFDASQIPNVQKGCMTNYRNNCIIDPFCINTNITPEVQQQMLYYILLLNGTRARVIGSTTIGKDVYVTGVSTYGIQLQSANGFQSAQPSVSESALIPISFTFIAKFSETGKLIWHTRLDCEPTNGIIAYNNSPISISSDDTGIYISGVYTNNISIYNAGSSVFDSPIYSGITLPSTPPPSPVILRESFIIKYDTNGQYVWGTILTSTSATTTTSIQIVNSFVSNSSIYIVGTFTTNITYYNAVTQSNPIPSGTSINIIGLATQGFIAKYNTNGQIVWATITNTISTAAAFPLCISSCGSDIYVCGNYIATPRFYNANGSTPTLGLQFLSSATTLDMFIAKYDSNGQVIWATRIGGSGTEGSRYITCDLSGYVYVCGLATSNPVDIYNANGNNPILSGLSINSGGLTNILVKYNNNGQLTWGTTISTTASNLGVSSIVIKNDKLYVNGSYSNSITLYNQNGLSQPVSSNIVLQGYPTAINTYLCCYDLSGIAQWGTMILRTERPGILNADDNGIYLPGFVTGSNTAFNSSAPNNNDMSTKILDPITSNISSYTANSYSTLVHYDISGQVKWGTIINPIIDTNNISSISEYDNFIAIGGQMINSCEPYNANNSSQQPTSSGLILQRPLGITSSLGFIVQYDISGQVKWGTYIVNSIAVAVNITSIYNKESIYACGTFFQNYTCYNANGLSSPTTSGLTITESVANFSELLVSYDISGQLQWATKITSTASSIAAPYLTVNENNIYNVGTFITNITFHSASGSTPIASLTFAPGNTAEDIFISNYDISGQVKWATRIGGNGAEQGPFVTADSSGFIYISGTYRALSNPLTLYNAAFPILTPPSNTTPLLSGITIPGPVGISAGFIAKYDSSGQAIWGTKMDGTSADNAFKLKEINNNIYVTGIFTGAITFFDASGNSSIPSSITLTAVSPYSSNELFIAKYDSSGKAIWATQITTLATEAPTPSITVDNNYIYVSVTISASNTSDTILLYNSDLSIAAAIYLNSINQTQLTIAYDHNGLFKWYTQVGGCDTTTARDITATSSNSIITVGTGTQFATSNMTNDIYEANQNANPTYFTTTESKNNVQGYLIKYSLDGKLTS